MELLVLCLIIVDDQEMIGRACSPLCLGTVALLRVLVSSVAVINTTGKRGDYFSL